MMSIGNVYSACYFLWKILLKQHVYTMSPELKFVEYSVQVQVQTVNDPSLDFQNIFYLFYYQLYPKERK